MRVTKVRFATFVVVGVALGLLGSWNRTKAVAKIASSPENPPCACEGAQDLPVIALAESVPECTAYVAGSWLTGPRLDNWVAPAAANNMIGHWEYAFTWAYSFWCQSGFVNNCRVCNYDVFQYASPSGWITLKNITGEEPASTCNQGHLTTGNTIFSTWTPAHLIYTGVVVRYQQDFANWDTTTPGCNGQWYSTKLSIMWTTAAPPP